jgi:hypothetical protein
MSTSIPSQRQASQQFLSQTFSLSHGRQASEWHTLSVQLNGTFFVAKALGNHYRMRLNSMSTTNQKPQTSENNRNKVIQIKRN